MTITLQYTATGPPAAHTLVLLNSVGATSAMWDPLLGALAEQFRVVRINARGHGGSPPSNAGERCTIADLGRDVLAVLDRLDVARVHLAGLSLGGMTAMWLAIHHPERVDRLALLCTSAHLAPAHGWLDRATAVRSGGLASIAEAVVARWLTPGLAKRDPLLRDALAAMLISTDDESYAQCCEAIADLDLRPDLGRVAAPTLIVAAVDDPATPPGHAYRIAEGIAGSRVAVLEDAAHIATVEQSGQITQLLLQHFGGGATVRAGDATRRSVLGDAHVDRATANASEFTAPFQEFLTRYAWGDVWTRPGLSRRERSITTLGALVALGAEHEIALHVRAAIRNGLTASEISEVLLHTAVYSGLPRANRAFAIAQQTLRDIDDENQP